MQTGLVFNIQKYSVQDGPGIRTTVFLKGCPLCCSWCHNPEGISPRREAIVRETRCIVCGECRKVCAFAATLTGHGPLPTRVQDCTLCGECVEACPTGARQMVGREMTVTQVMSEVLQDRVFYEGSSGGVTFSGGEPLLQPAFLLDLLHGCRARGLHTAVDTCGFACTEVLLEVAQLANLLLFDLKLMDDARHQAHTGVSNRPILQNLMALDGLHRDLWIRVPVIPGVNDDHANLEAIARFAHALTGVRKVNLLGYHRTGVAKAQRLGRAQALETKAPPTERLQAIAELFRGFGLVTRIGG